MHNTESGQNPARNADVRPGALLHNIESGQNPAIHTKNQTLGVPGLWPQNKHGLMLAPWGAPAPQTPRNGGLPQIPPAGGLGEGSGGRVAPKERKPILNTSQMPATLGTLPCGTRRAKLVQWRPSADAGHVRSRPTPRPWARDGFRSRLPRSHGNRREGIGELIN